MSEEEIRTGEWIHVGSRRNSKGNRVTAWLCDDGVTRYWTERTSFITGGVYEARYHPDGDTVVRHGDPVFIRQHPDQDQRAGWRAAERADMAVMEREALERKAKRDDDLEEALKPLIRYASRLRGYDKRAGLAAYVLERILSASAREQVQR